MRPTAHACPQIFQRNRERAFFIELFPCLIQRSVIGPLAGGQTGLVAVAINVEAEVPQLPATLDICRRRIANKLSLIWLTTGRDLHAPLTDCSCRAAAGGLYRSPCN